MKKNFARILIASNGIHGFGIEGDFRNVMDAKADAAIAVLTGKGEEEAVEELKRELKAAANHLLSIVDELDMFADD